MTPFIFTVKRFTALQEAAAGDPFPGTDGARTSLARDRAIEWDESEGAWRITERGREYLKEWNASHKLNRRLIKAAATKKQEAAARPAPASGPLVLQRLEPRHTIAVMLELAATHLRQENPPYVVAAMRVADAGALLRTEIERRGETGPGIDGPTSLGALLPVQADCADGYKQPFVSGFTSDADETGAQRGG